MQEYIPQLERASTPLVGAQASACDRVCIVRFFCTALFCLLCVRAFVVVAFGFKILQCQ